MKDTNERDFVCFKTQNQNLMEVFRENVRNVYESRGMTLEKFAELADLSVDTLKNIIYRDTKDCYLSNAFNIARALQCSMDVLTGISKTSEYIINGGYLTVSNGETVSIRLNIFPK